MHQENIQQLIQELKDIGLQDKKDFVFGENQFSGLSDSEKKQKYMKKAQEIAKEYNHISSDIIKAYFWTDNELLNITDQTGKERFENANKALNEIIEANKNFLENGTLLPKEEKGLLLFKNHALNIEHILQKNNVQSEERLFLGVILQDHYKYGFIPFQIKQIQEGHKGYKVESENNASFIREFVNSLQKDNILPGEEMTKK